MELKLLSKNQDIQKEWDHFVTSSPSGTLFHKSLWLNAWGGNYDLWGLYKGAELVAGFVAPYKSLLRMRVVVPPTLTHYSGILFKKYEGKYVSKITSEKEMARELAILVRKKYRRGILSFSPSIDDMQPFIWEGFEVSPMYTYLLDVSDPEQTLKEMNADTRNSIKKAQNDGLSVVVTDSIDEIIELVKKTFMRQGEYPTLSAAFKYHKELLRENLYKGFICVDKDGNKIATYCIVWDEKRSYGFLSGYDAKKKHKGATSLCVWEAIKYISKYLDTIEFDLEGSMIPKIERFNRNFGGKLTNYYEIKWGWGIDSMTKFRTFCNKYIKV